MPEIIEIISPATQFIEIVEVGPAGPPVSDGDKGGVVVSGNGAIWSVKRRLYAENVVVGSGSSQRATIQTYLDQLEESGGTLDLPDGPITINDATQLKIPSFVTMQGGRGGTTLVLGASCPTGFVIRNKTFDTQSPALIDDGVWLKDMIIDGSARGQRNTWLTNSAFVAITDPINDYLPGGCLSPATPATITGTFSGGYLVSLTIVSGGAGYVYPPSLRIVGNAGAEGMYINLTTSGGSVTGYTVADPGNGNYTSATFTVLGGGADPAGTGGLTPVGSALIAANRRNQNYTTRWSGITFIKTKNSGCEGVTFKNIYGDAMASQGSHGITSRNNVFVDGGKEDFVGMCHWFGAYSSEGNPGYRRTTSARITGCNVENWARSFAIFDGEGCLISDNVINGCGEGMIAAGVGSTGIVFCHNIVDGVNITDIVGTGFEVSDDPVVEANVFKNISGPVLGVDGTGGARVSGNTIYAHPSPPTTFPAGPYSERYGYADGAAARAFLQIPWSNRSSPFRFFDSSLSASAPQGFTLERNRIVVESGGRFDSLVNFLGIGSRPNALGNIIIRDNDLLMAPTTDIYDSASAAEWIDPAKPFIVRDNLGAMAATAYEKDIGTRTLANVTTAQSILGSAAPPIRAGTKGQFEIEFVLVRTAGTSVRVDFTLGAGTATLSSPWYDWNSLVLQEDVTADTEVTGWNDDGDLHDIVPAFTTSRARVKIKGRVTCDARGLFDPALTLSAAPGGAPQLTGLYFKFVETGLA